MAAKIYKGIRLEQELYDYIVNDIDGKDFTDKLHILINLSIKELPESKKKLAGINSMIKKKSSELNKIDDTIQKFKSLIWDYESMIKSMDRVKLSVDKVVNYCDNISNN